METLGLCHLELALYMTCIPGRDSPRLVNLRERGTVAQVGSIILRILEMLDVEQCLFNAVSQCTRAP